MCGIYGVLCPAIAKKIDINKIRQYHKVLRHRGPDWEGEVFMPDAYLAHHRLSIIDPSGGSQPICWNDGHQYLALSVNGEIYNYRELKQSAIKKQENDIYDYSGDAHKFKYTTNSDCEVLLALYVKATVGYRDDVARARLITALRSIDGIFAFIIVDVMRGKAFIARDSIGVIPLYYGYDTKGFLHFSSEMKAFPIDVVPNHFPPGQFMFLDIQTIGKEAPTFDKFCDITCRSIKQFAEPPESLIEHYKIAVREALSSAVERQLMTDVPFGALLSGGLDSSLVCSIIVRALHKQSIRETTNLTWDGMLRTFSIGLEGANSPDLKAAEYAAKWLGTKHYSFTFTLDEGMAAIRDVIWHLETYDVTTIRASTPMYLLSRKIKSMGIKMVLSGEGSDEIFGGYLYFMNAPDDDAHTEECYRRVNQLGFFDCLRANKSTMAWGVEARPPFLDLDLVKLGLAIPACLKRYKGIEKWILREAFNVEAGKQPYLPDDLLWRQKEQFSDGVGYGWIDKLKEEADNQVTDYVLSLAVDRYPVNTPQTKEEYHYRTIFEELFPGPGRDRTVKKWVPRTDWPGVAYDASGRCQQSHINKLV